MTVVPVNVPLFSSIFGTCTQIQYGGCFWLERKTWQLSSRKWIAQEVRSKSDRPEWHKMMHFRECFTSKYYFSLYTYKCLIQCITFCLFVIVRLFFCGFNSGHSLSLRSSPRVPHRLDSNATLTESKPTVASTASSQSHDSAPTLSSVNEESMSLAQKKGPLPPIPINARIATLELNCNASVQNVDSTVPVPSWVPPPPSYQAPTVPPSSVVSMCSYIVWYLEMFVNTCLM